MKLRSFIALIAILSTFPSANANSAAIYKATLLHPLSGFEESLAWNVSGNDQVGSSSGYAVHKHALYWNSTSESVVDLHPPGFTSSETRVTSGDSQIGFGDGKALLWRGTPQSVVDLHPTGFDLSYAYGASGNTQVGVGQKISPEWESHALLWNGTAESVVDLNPPGYAGSAAYAIFGNKQFGESSVDMYSSAHATMWTGTAESAVDLHPRGFLTSAIRDASDELQVGWGWGPENADHAILWNGTAESAIDLHPAGFVETRAWGVSGNFQVGSGWGEPTGPHEHALLWNGTAESFVDLHPFLADLQMDFVNSYATDIDENGTIVGFAIRHDNTHEDGTQWQAVMWTPIAVPEPNAQAVVIGCIALLTLFTRYKRTKQKRDF